MNRTGTGTWIDDRVQTSEPATRSMPVSFSALDFWAIVLPAVSFIEITIVGRLIVTEQLQEPKASFAAFLCRRSAWEASLRLYGDWGLWLRSGAVGSIVTAHRLVARYRTGYPGSRLADRIVDCAHDECVIELDIAPLAVDAVGLSSQETVRLAMGRRLLAFLATAAAVGDPESRAGVADELRPMVAALFQERMVDRFVAGKVVRAAPKPGTTARGLGSLAAQFRTLALSESYLAGRG